jgi:hypothetical protein
VKNFALTISYRLTAIGAIALFLGGCAQATKESATIDRFAEVPRATFVAAFAAAALQRGYVDLGGGAWQRVIEYRKDPILGLVKISEDPQSAMWMAPEFIAVGDTASRLRLAPQSLVWLWPVADKRLHYWPPGSVGHAEATALVDSAVTEALASQRLKQ